MNTAPKIPSRYVVHVLKRVSARRAKAVNSGHRPMMSAIGPTTSTVTLRIATILAKGMPFPDRDAANFEKCRSLLIPLG